MVRRTTGNIDEKDGNKIEGQGEKKIDSDGHGDSRYSIFQIDPQSRHIEDGGFRCRAIIVNERFWNRTRDELLNLTKEMGPLILYQLGHSYGLEVGMQGREKMAGGQGAGVKFLEQYGFQAGWGRLDMSKMNIFNGRLDKPAEVKIFDNFFARASRAKPAILAVSIFQACLRE